MRSKAIFMALLALALGSRAASVSQEDVKSAALGWVSRGGHFGVRFGSLVESAAVHTTTNGAKFYSVKMYGGGTVFMSADSDMDPVIAFTDSPEDFSSIDRRSPLWALLNGDMSMRRTAVDTRPVVMVNEASSTWYSLIERGEVLSTFSVPFAASAAARSSAPGDLRVSPLLASKWSQSNVGESYMFEKACFNYYTPIDASGVIQEGMTENAVCGCVATAMGQIMYYHRYPEAATPPANPDTCWFGETELTLQVSGEAYAWDAMVDSPTTSTPEDSLKAMGLLTSDAGRSVGMQYTTDDSGSYTFKASKSFVDVFGFGQSVFADFRNDSTTTVGPLTSSPSTLGKVVFSNLDAGYPIMLGIRGKAGGHEICADGYGYHDGAPYVHLNMGWSGNGNLWYNMPSITYKNMSFDTIEDAIYNIIPSGAGLGVMSGRVVDEDGAALGGAVVSVFEAGTGAAVTQLVTSASGVWGVALPGGTYDISVQDAEASRCEDLAGISLAVPVQTETSLNWRSPTKALESGKYPVVADAVDLGNSWGNDVTLMYPRVRIVNGGVTNVYSSLDRAIAGARAIALSGATPVLEILRDVVLEQTAAIDFSCALCAATGDESSTRVDRPYGAGLVVESGAELWVSNCVFAATGHVPVSVKSGGKVFVGPGFSAERVVAGDVNGFNVVGHVTADIAVECSQANVPGDVFGWAYADDQAALSNSVARLYATFDPDGETRGDLAAVSPGVYRLVWAKTAVPVGSSVGYYVTSDGATNTSAVVDLLFARYKNACAAGLMGSSRELVLVGRDDSGLSGDLVVSTNMVLRGVGGAFLMPTAASHIIVTNGGSLVVSNLAIGDRTGDTMVRVLSGGSLTLGLGASLTNVVCTGNAGNSNTMPGPVAVYAGGDLRLEGGSRIIDCAAAGEATFGAVTGGNCGGGVYLFEGATLDLAGGSVVGCSAVKSGGGVYAAMGSDVVVTGPSVVEGNFGKNDIASDVLLVGGSNVVSVEGPAAGGRIGIRHSSGSDNNAGVRFGEASSAGLAASSAGAFFNDAKDGLVAAADGTALRWAVAPPVVPPTPTNVVAVVTFDGKTITNESVSAAFECIAAATGPATITLHKNCSFDGNLVVAGAVTLCSAPGATNVLSRGGDFSIVVGAGASLAMSDVAVSGAATIDAANPLFAVAGGSFELGSGASIYGVSAAGNYAAAVSVSAGGTFTMRDGALISGCVNSYLHSVDRTAFAGGLVVNGEGSMAYLRGGAITNCAAARAGGACAINGGEIHISGAVSVIGNYVLSAAAGNVVAAHGAMLVLDDTFTGTVGDRADSGSDKALIGEVSDGFSGDDADLVRSAMNFKSDEGYGYGVPVRSAAGKTILVWSERLSAMDGSYKGSDGTAYSVVMASPAVLYPVDAPVAAPGLVYNGETQTGVAAHLGYSLSGTHAAASAGNYTATATLSSGYVWSDGTSAPKVVNWSIAKATYDMSGVTFESKMFVYDGTAKSIEISGDLPAGVTVNYGGNNKTGAGRYLVVAKFYGDSVNYNAIPDKTAMLIILYEIAKPAAAGLVYNASMQTGVASGSGYTLSGEVAGVDAGSNYVAVATLDSSHVWDDGTTNALEIVWSISPAPLTVSANAAQKKYGASDPASFAYSVEGLQGADTAADVLTGALVRDAGENPGAYAIRQGTLAVKAGEPNYAISDYKLDFFRILDSGSSGGGGDSSAVPLPVAFTAVECDAGTWTLTVTSAVENCWYSLYETNSLVGGFQIDGVEPVTNRQATALDVPSMIFTRPKSGSQLFWRVRAEPEDAH